MGTVCAQKNHKGVVVLSVMLHEGANDEAGSTAKNPESTALGPGAHGVAKVDSVTEWFFDMNWKWIVSPSWAVTEVGLKANWPPSPTEMLISAAEAARAETRAKAAKENIMFSNKKKVGTVERRSGNFNKW